MVDRRKHGPDTSKVSAFPTGSNSVGITMPCLCGAYFCSWQKSLHVLDMEHFPGRTLTAEECAAEFPALAI